MTPDRWWFGLVIWSGVTQRLGRQCLLAPEVLTECFLNFWMVFGHLEGASVLALVCPPFSALGLDVFCFLANHLLYTREGTKSHNNMGKWTYNSPNSTAGCMVGEIHHHWETKTHDLRASEVSRLQNKEIMWSWKVCMIPRNGDIDLKNRICSFIYICINWICSWLSIDPCLF